MRIALLLLGFGHVGRRFVQLLQEQRTYLDAVGVTPVVVGIGTGRHGSVWDAAGLDASQLAHQVADGNTLGASHTASQLIAQLVAQRAVLSAEAHVMVETTPLEIGFGEPATTHVREALRAGAHVISANKGPVAQAYAELAEEARRAGREFLFEGAVMDGIPVFSLVRETMPGVTITGFRGVVNSTTNHILTALERGEDFDEALARMQAQGIAEADPSLDVDGWDAAAKVAAMANVWMDARVRPQDVARSGIGRAEAARARQAAAAGRRLKLVASGKRRRVSFSSKKTPDVFLKVGLEELQADDPLAQLDGQANALELETDQLGRVVITQRDGGLEKTAYALFGDLMRIVYNNKKDVGCLFP